MKVPVLVGTVPSGQTSNYFYMLNLFGTENADGSQGMGGLVGQATSLNQAAVIAYSTAAANAAKTVGYTGPNLPTVPQVIQWVSVDAGVYDTQYDLEFGAPGSMPKFAPASGNISAAIKTGYVYVPNGETLSLDPQGNLIMTPPAPVTPVVETGSPIGSAVPGYTGLFYPSTTDANSTTTIYPVNSTYTQDGHTYAKIVSITFGLVWAQTS